MLKVNISHILEEACPATLAASEAKVALLNSELIVIILPKPAPGSSTTLLTLMYNVNDYNYPQLINIQVTQSIDFTSDYLINNLKPYNLNAIQPTLSCNLLSVVDILNLSLTIVLQFHKKKVTL